MTEHNPLHVWWESNPVDGSVNVGTSGTLLVPRDEARLALIIGCPQTNRITLGQRSNVVLDEGVTLYPAGPPLVLSLREHGGLVKGPIYAISAVGAQDVWFWGSSNSCPCVRA